MATSHIVGFVIIGVFAIACFIVLSAISWKLYDIYTELLAINRHVGRILADTTNVKYKIDDIRDYTQSIFDEVCLEEECCDDDTEVEKDEEVKTIDAGELIAELDRIVDRIEEDEIDIHLITAEQYHFGNGYSKNELKYFPNTDQVVCDIDSYTRLVMEDIPEYIGDGLLFFGMNVKEPNVVYVRNHILNADFRIEKFNGKCEDYD